MRRRASWLGVVSVVLVVFLYLPLVVAVLFAFNSGESLTWPIKGFTLRWFDQIFSDPAFRRSLRTSVIAGFATALIAGAIGTAAAIVFTRRRSGLARSVEGLSLLPVMLPPLFLAVGLVATMKLTDTAPSLWTIVLGHTIVAVPFVIVVVAARLRSYDVELELAARDLGARPAQVLRRITLPIILPAIVGGLLLAFAISFDEILITNFTSGTESTIPIYVFGRLRRFIDPSVNAVAVTLLVIPWLALLVGALFLRRSPGLSAQGAAIEPQETVRA
jgi:ABC-type spermidine/putrescine transport system permease subunit II